MCACSCASLRRGPPPRPRGARASDVRCPGPRRHEGASTGNDPRRAGLVLDGGCADRREARHARAHDVSRSAPNARELGRFERRRLFRPLAPRRQCRRADARSRPLGDRALTPRAARHVTHQALCLVHRRVLAHSQPCSLKQNGSATLTARLFQGRGWLFVKRATRTRIASHQNSSGKSETLPHGEPPAQDGR